MTDLAFHAVVGPAEPLVRVEEVAETFDEAPTPVLAAVRAIDAGDDQSAG